jgi:hypothetical protein
MSERIFDAHLGSEEQSLLSAAFTKEVNVRYAERDPISRRDRSEVLAFREVKVHRTCIPCPRT